MSRTRKGGKYKGGSFASQFKQGLSMQSPMYAVAVSDGSTEEAPIDKIDGKPPELSELEDVVDEKVGSSARRVERQNWKVRAEQEAERQKAEAKALEEQREQEALQAEEDREARSQGQEILDETTKRGIKDAKKEAKQTARDEKRGKIEDIKASGVKGKAKRQAKRKARKEFRKDKKQIRKNKRTAKRNRRKGK